MTLPTVREEWQRRQMQRRMLALLSLLSVLSATPATAANARQSLLAPIEAAVGLRLELPAEPTATQRRPSSPPSPSRYWQALQAPIDALVRLTMRQTAHRGLLWRTDERCVQLLVRPPTVP